LKKAANLVASACLEFARRRLHRRLRAMVSTPTATRSSPQTRPRPSSQSQYGLPLCLTNMSGRRNAD
jgi:hypothetical protein